MNGEMTGEAREVEMEVLPPESKEDHLTRVLAALLDDFIFIPGVNFRIGLDPIISLVPGFGVVAAALLGALIPLHAFWSGVPRIVILRMVMNLLINGAMGAVPGIGDVFSAWYKSNRRNYNLLRRHTGAVRVSTAADWLFIVGVLGGALAGILVASILVLYVIYHVFVFLFHS